MRTDLETRTIWAYGEIQEHGDFSASNMQQHLHELGKGDVTVRLNTDGGSVTEGWAIYGALDRHDGKITTINDSVAASMGSVIFLAGDVRLATPYCQFMLHSPHTATTGSKKELRKSADTLEQFEKTMRNAYLNVMDVTESELIDLLEAETWVDADAAVRYGLATGFEESSCEATKMVKASGITQPSSSQVAASQRNLVWARWARAKKTFVQRIRAQALVRHSEGLQARFAGYSTPTRFTIACKSTQSQKPKTPVLTLDQMIARQAEVRARLGLKTSAEKLEAKHEECMKKLGITSAKERRIQQKVADTKHRRWQLDVAEKELASKRAAEVAAYEAAEEAAEKQKYEDKIQAAKNAKWLQELA